MTDNICCACGGPGMTQVETGKWLCQKHSPWTSGGPKFDEYLKQKGVELHHLFGEVIWCLNKFRSEIDQTGCCPSCKADVMQHQKHDESCPIFILDLVCDLSLFEYHPYLFFSLISEDSVFLQEGRIFGEQSKYITELKQKFKGLIEHKLELRQEVKVEQKAAAVKVVTKQGLSEMPTGMGDDNWF